MDCIGCAKCRLWGKVQTMGVATALKVLFELDETALQPHSQLLQRTEIVAMMNTLYRFSESLKAVDDFRKMWRDLDTNESHSLAAKAEAAATAVVRVLFCCSARNALTLVSQPVPQASPHVGKTLPTSFVDQVKSWLTVCRVSTVDCINIFVRQFWQVVRALSAIFRPSGKDKGPRMNADDEL